MCFAHLCLIVPGCALRVSVSEHKIRSPGHSEWNAPQCWSVRCCWNPSFAITGAPSGDVGVSPTDAGREKPAAGVVSVSGAEAKGAAAEGAAATSAAATGAAAVGAAAVGAAATGAAAAGAPTNRAANAATGAAASAQKMWSKEDEGSVVLLHAVKSKDKYNLKKCRILSVNTKQLRVQVIEGPASGEDIKRSWDNFSRLPSVTVGDMMSTQGNTDAGAARPASGITAAGSSDAVAEPARKEARFDDGLEELDDIFGPLSS